MICWGGCPNGPRSRKNSPSGRNVTARTDQTSLRRELGLADLVLAQVLCVVGSAWVGIAAKIGRAHVVMWMVAMLLFYVPLAVVVIHLNRRLPLEAVLVWIAAPFSSVFVYEAVKAWQYRRRPNKAVFRP